VLQTCINPLLNHVLGPLLNQAPRRTGTSWSETKLSPESNPVKIIYRRGQTNHHLTKGGAATNIYTRKIKIKSASGPPSPAEIAADSAGIAI
jgi:hypothetical protein